jgi:glycine/D-amino acid oxidase-like deaminating enzyme
MRIAIIGAGFCGLATAWYLLSHSPSFPNLQIVIFDKLGIGKGASGMSAGLLHPFAGAHAKLNWQGYKSMQATKELIEVSSQALGSSVISPNRGILRLAVTTQQQNDFTIRSHHFQEDMKWLTSSDCQKVAPGCIDAPGLWIKEGLVIYAPLYLKGLWLACANQGVQFIQQKISSLEDTSDFDITIFTIGAYTTSLPELASLPLRVVKGQLMELKWPTTIPPLQYALNSHLYLVMSKEQKSCIIGATYERNYTSPAFDLETAKNQLLPKLSSFFPPAEHMSILQGFAGLRSTTPTHRPLMQRISPTRWVLAGMGSKGLLYHALCARELVNSIWQENFAKS